MIYYLLFLFLVERKKHVGIEQKIIKEKKEHMHMHYKLNKRKKLYFSGRFKKVVVKTGLTVDDYLIKIPNWANQWKMWFNPEVTKQAQEVVFSSNSK